jgi:O-antigen/teichoic acid export membrane protein
MTTDAAPSSQRTALASASLIAARLAGRSIDLVSLLVLARLLTPGDFGIVAIAMSLILIVEAVLELPVGQVLLVEKTLNRRLLDTAFTIGVARGLALALFVCAAALPFAFAYKDPRLAALVCALALAPVFRGIQNPAMIAYDRALDFKRQITIDLASKVFSCLFASALAYMTHSYWALAVGTVLSPLLMLAMSFAAVPYRPRITFVEWRLFRSFLGWLSAGQVFSALTWQVDRLVLGWAMTKPEVGRFTMADNLSALPNQVLLTPLIGPLSVTLARVRDDRQRLQGVYLKLMSTVALVGFPALTGLAILADPFVRLALGPAWSSAGEILRWLALASIPSLLTTPFNTLALATKRSWLVFGRQIVEFVVKVPTAIGLVLSYGLIGACVARAIATTCVSVASLFAVRNIASIGVGDQLKAVSRPALSSAIMAALLYWPVAHLSTAATIPVLLATMMGLALAGALIYTASIGILWKIAGSPDGGELFLFNSLLHFFQGMRRKVEA